MKAITLYQPWATLIAIGAKTFETRPWRTEYRGPLAIHAGKTHDYSIYTDNVFLRALGDGGYSYVYELPLGCIVATCELVSCMRITPKTWEGISRHDLAFGNWEPGRFAWELRKVQKLETPIPARGAMGLWEWENPNQ